MGKSAARLWREYQRMGGTLPFPAWLTREKTKFHSANGEDGSLLMIDRTLNDSVHQVIKESISPAAPPKKSGTTVFGINKTVFIVGGLLVLAAGIYLITQHSKK